jgi:hypothetical protein
LGVRVLTGSLDKKINEFCGAVCQGTNVAHPIFVGSQAEDTSRSGKISELNPQIVYWHSTIIGD